MIDNILLLSVIPGEECTKLYSAKWITGRIKYNGVVKSTGVRSNSLKLSTLLTIKFVLSCGQAIKLL